MKEGEGMESIVRMFAKIKPCPFCGKVKTLTLEIEEDPTCFYVFCDPSEGGCGSSGGACIRMDAAIDAWNERKQIE